MNKMRCIVVDDEPLAREGMKLNIEELSFLNLEGMFSTAIKAGEYLLEHQTDLLFLDIEMPGLNGLDFLRSLSHKPIVILTTAYPQYALEAFELEVLDYLVKPIRFDRFFKAVSKAKELHELKANSLVQITIDQKDDFIFIKSGRKIIKLFHTDIKYIKGMKDYVIIYTLNERFMTAMNIKTINAQLPDEVFARVSKSYIINVTRIKSIDHDVIDLNGDEIPLGRSYKASFLGKYIDGNLVDRSKNKQ